MKRFVVCRALLSFVNGFNSFFYIITSNSRGDCFIKNIYMNLTKSRTAKFLSGFVGLALAFSFVVVPTASAQTSAQLQEQIASMLATINALQAQLSATTGTASSVGAYTFNTNLTVGSKGVDVMNLQKVLNSSADTMVAMTGAGSPGMETSFFGPATKAAVMKFQAKYGISPVAGYVGAITRAKLNTMGGVVVPPPTTTLPAGCTSTTGYSSTTGLSCSTGTALPTGGSLMVVAGSQPANSLAPQSAARIPFTTLTLSAGSSDVTVNSITVERSGLAQDAVIAGAVLLDQNGMQIGIAKTLNSNHQAMVGEPFVIKAGTSKMVTIAGNMASSLTNYAGQVVGLNVVAINTTASVSGSLPIMGAQHTVNASLTLGSVTMAVSSYDPNSSQTKEIGTTGYKFSGVRVTAGSAEKIKLWSVRWNQSGSASSNDLENVKVYVDGTAYDTVVSSDGKYYSAIFPGGLLIDKGLAKDIYIQGDVVGAGSAGRTIKFDIYKTTDLYISGDTYMYGITPPVGSGTAADTTSEFTASTPWFDGSKVTVSGGSATSIGKATSVTAQNIAVNVPNQVLGGFTTDIKGEPMSIQSMAFTIATSGAWTSSSGITNITIVDQNGAVVAGPIDEATTCTSGCTITFTDTVTLPVGVRTYTLKGKIPTGAPNGATVVVSATPSSGWTSVTGQTTGNTITLTNGAFSMNTMTVKAAALTISVASTPSAQSIVTGGTTLFTNLQFDASQSGEDVRFGQIPLAFDQGNNATAGAPSKLTSCQLFDGTTALNTGSNVVNPSTTATTTSPLSTSFTLDSQFTVPKGTVKTLALKCNVATGADSASVFQWGLTNGTAMTVTGVTSGADVSESLTTANGPLMTVATGSFTASINTPTSSYTIVPAGITGVEIGSFKFIASNEDVNLTKVGLVLSTSTPSDLNLGVVGLYNASGTLLGTATFTGNSTTATSTLNSPLLLTKGSEIVLKIKADLAMIGNDQPGTEGRLIKIDVTNAEGTGVSSGGTLQVGGVTAGVNGVRMFKSIPTLSQDTLSTSGVADGKLMRFKVKADAKGPVGLYNFNFTIATSVASVTNVELYAFSDSSYSSAVSTNLGSGLFDATNGASNGSLLASNPTIDFVSDTTALQVGAGETVYFELRATVSGVATGASVTTTLNGDAAYIDASHLGAYFVSTTTGAVADTNNDFIWSGNATTTAVFNANDWANGYGVPGLPAGGFSQTRGL